MKGLKYILAGALGIAASAFGTAQAAVLPLTFDGQNSGWTASWDNSLDDPIGNQVSLTVDNLTRDTVVIEKHAVFQDVSQFGGIVPIVIAFQQNSLNAVRYIAFDDETVFNQTGLDWNGFRFIVEDGMTGTTMDIRFDTAQSAGFSITPFTTTAYSQNNQILEVGGGVVPSAPPGVVGPNVWFPGVAAGALVIDTSPIQGVLRSFSFKEAPLAIPLPAAAWSGLSGLAGLALVGLGKNAKKLMA